MINMNDSFKDKESKSTPERKKEYIQHWLNGQSFVNAHLSSDTREKTPPNLSKFHGKCAKSLVLLNSVEQKQKYPTSCPSQISPILGEKRSASSPVIGGHRRISKRIKLVKKLNINQIKEHQCTNSIQSAEKSEIQAKSEKNEHHIKPANILDYDNILDESITSKSNEKVNIINETSTKIPEIVEDVTSQIIESISSEDKSIDNSEVNAQEILSVTDKTESDLIEDISTQLIVDPSCWEKHIPLSQNISNPSSNSSESTNYIDPNESNVTAVNTNQQYFETLTSTDQIDSISTLGSRPDFSKTSYILHYADEKAKKKKNPKKGSLLDIVVTAMTKERSNVNLFRHQLHKKLDIIEEKPFVLLQILQHLSINNHNQFFKCLLIEDSRDLLKDLLKNKSDHFITVMNVPEISCIVNVNEKPMLKVYQPWTILNPNQLLIHITRFIAVPSSNPGKLALISDNMQNINLKIIREFNCPCLDEKALSIKCHSKYTDISDNIVKILFSYS